MNRRIEEDIVSPRASALLNSLRAVGYTLSTAVADIVDNSITAGATRIYLDAQWAGPESYIRIADDGVGMTEPDLVEAMRLGSRNPLDERELSDLGRFGLGLKTASFSQCKNLSVASKTRDTDTVVRRWDLDLVTARDEWVLLRQPSPGSENLLKISGTEGTVVLWQSLNSVVQSAQPSAADARNRFYEQLTLLKNHLGMVFHRFLVGLGRIEILFNGRPLIPWDPFMVSHVASQPQPEERLGRHGEEILVRPFVLPHVSRLSSEEHSSASGLKGWNAQQGFYVYRNERLLVAGDWLGLGFQQEEHFKLARIAVDLPNSVDFAWDIDVKKSKATPPDFLREPLCRIAKATRKRASEVYRHRGKVLARTAGKPEVLWQRKVVGDRVEYVINRKYPLVSEVLENLGPKEKRLKTLLRLVEETVPVHTIVIDSSERPDQHGLPYEGKPSKEIIDAADLVCSCLIKSGLSKKSAQARTLVLEPFSQYQADIQAFFEASEDGE